MTDTLMINEIFYSIQGESTWAGMPCTFVRLMGCHLRCHYCDTAYAFHEGGRQTIKQVIEQVQAHGCQLVEVTGGEPLLQPRIHDLMSRLCDSGYIVLIETSGACDISRCDPRVHRIVDLKTPGSGEVQRNLWSNIEHLKSTDEVKLVITSREDYQWARDVVIRYDLAQRAGAVLMGAAAPMAAGPFIAGCEGLDPRSLAEWILADRLPVRMQTQLHKLIWDPAARGV